MPSVRKYFSTLHSHQCQVTRIYCLNFSKTLYHIYLHMVTVIMSVTYMLFLGIYFKNTLFRSIWRISARSIVVLLIYSNKVVETMLSKDIQIPSGTIKFRTNAIVVHQWTNNTSCRATICKCLLNNLLIKMRTLLNILITIGRIMTMMSKSITKTKTLIFQSML